MAYIPASSFPPHFHKPDGSLAVGCTLAAFVAQTTTPTPFYLDAGGTEAGTSITLNDRGEPEVSGNSVVLWVDTEVVYKFVLTDPDGQQWSVDDILSPVRQATTVNPGIVQLYDDIDSDSDTLAATANALRIVAELAQSAITIASSGVPVGSEIFWPTNTPPSALWQECDGGSLAVAEYPEYFAVIGYTHGGSGANFNKPDWRGKFPRGWAHGSTNDPDRASRTNRGDGTTGDNVGTNQAAAVGPHTHPSTIKGKFDNGISPPGFVVGGFSDYEDQVVTSENPSGAGSGGDTRPINMSRLIMVKVKSSL